MESQGTYLRVITGINDALLKIETFLLALITISLVAAIFIEVICRYFLFISVAWAEELTRYLFIWLSYIGSAYAVYQGSHTEIDVLRQAFNNMKEPLRSKGLRMLELFAIVSTFLFLVFFGQIFFNYMIRIWHTTQTSPTMHIPMGLVYLPVFVGIVLCAFHEIYLLAVWFSKGRSASAVAE